jgi:hypothetical protein
VSKPAIRPKIHADLLEAIEWCTYGPRMRWGEAKLMENPNSKLGVLMRCRKEVAELRAENEALRKALVKAQQTPPSSPSI